MEAKPMLGVGLAIFAVLVCAATAVATFYEWTGQGNDDYWTTEDNWQPNVLCQTDCYPHSGDDAEIGLGQQEHVCLEQESMHDLTLDGDAVLDDWDSSDPVLTVDTVTIGNNAVITIEDGARIVGA